MDKDFINPIDHGAHTMVDIVQMAQYQVKYVLEGDDKDKENMYKYAFLAGTGIARFLTIE